MSSLVLNGDTSGSVTVTVPSAAGTNTVTVAAQTGTLNAAGPAFYATSAGVQTLTSATITKAALANETFDTNNNFDSTTNYRFTPTVAGYYQFNLTFLAAASTSLTQGVVYLYKNGNTVSYNIHSNYSTTGVSVSHSDLVYLNGSTDYVEMFVRATGTGTITVDNNTLFSGCLVRGA